MNISPIGVNLSAQTSANSNLQNLKLVLGDTPSSTVKVQVNAQTQANRKVAQAAPGSSNRVDLRPGTTNSQVRSQLSRAGIDGQMTVYEAAWTTYPPRFEAAQTDAERSRIVANSDVMVVQYFERSPLTVYQRGGPQDGFEVNLQSRTITNNNTGRTVRLPEGALSVAQQGDRLSVTWSGRPLSSFFAPANARPATPTRSSTPLF
jgi:hypothetical protein